MYSIDPACGAVDPRLACVGAVNVADKSVDHVEVEDGIVCVVLVGSDG